jgi:pimeloyl-ACP methyl ester carboxylesterase
VAVVVCIPGAADSEHSFRHLTTRWPRGVVPIFHNIAGLTGEVPLHHYSWRIELDRLRARVEHLPDPRVFLLGMSGGATLALAYVADCPDTVAGIGLIEPAWSFLPLTPVEQRYYAALDRVLTLPPAEQRDAFVQLLVAADVSLPPVTSTAAQGYQRTQRPQETALAVVTRAMQSYQVDRTRLVDFRGPVYLAIGGRSSPMWRAQAAQIKAFLPQTIVEIYPDRHHLDAPHHADVQRLAESLLAAWQLE